MIIYYQKGVTKINITGTIINYYMHCKRQCYLSYHNIGMEQNSELVAIGKVLHEEKAKKSKNTEISIDNIKLDKISDQYITEIKKSDADTDASIMQLKYYMYILAKKGVIKDGKLEIIEKTKDKKVVIINYNDNIEKEIENLISKIEEYLNGGIEEFHEEKKCKKCAYYEYCRI